MSELVIMRGIPGSGKSTLAKQWVEEDDRRTRVNRDEIRMMLFGKEYNVNEIIVSMVEDEAIRALLRFGHDVVVDNTCIRWIYVTHYAKIAKEFNSDTSIWLVDVDLQTAYTRNARRASAGGRFVPTDVIESMHRVLQANKYLRLA